ncbi:MAG TPA: nitroreductase family deazaflavin-dependent oxidoreductase [Dehalococcoidia bacterium]|nr:nitroreductase family deazaflavin-dependent oxidoreductase [Dehalococcoidia bacterium]
MSEIDIHEMNRDVVTQFRANEGKAIEGRFAGTDLLLLHHKGAKSGEWRVNPLMFLKDGDRHVIFASRNGGPHHPDWYHNLVANPDIEVEVGTEKFAAKAVVTTGAERQRVWAQCVAQRPFLTDHAARAHPREIPVICIERK